MHKFINATLSVNADEGQEEAMARAMDKLSRVALGLALDGVTVTLSVAKLECEEETATNE